MVHFSTVVFREFGDDSVWILQTGWHLFSGRVYSCICECSISATLGILIFKEDRSIIDILRNLAEWWVEGSSSNFGGDLLLHGADGARARRHSLASGVAACSGCGHQCTILFGHFHFRFLHCSTVDCLAVVGLVDDHFSAASYSVPSSGTVSLCNP